VLMLFLVDSAAATVCAQIAKFSSAIQPLREFAERIYAQRVPNSLSDWRFEARLANDFEDQNLRRTLSELKEKLRTAGPEAEALVRALPEKGRFSLDLPPTAITVKD